MTKPAVTVYVIGPLPPPVHGASVVTAEVVERVRASGAHVRVFSTAGVGSGWRYHLSRLRPHAQAFALLLFAYLSRQSPRVYLAGAGGKGIWYHVPFVWLARRCMAPVVYHHHSYAYLTRKSLGMSLLTRVGANHTKHVVLCPDMGAQLGARYPRATNMSVCSNAAFVARPGTGPTSAEAVLRFGHMSNLSLNKGLGVVLDSFLALHQQGLPVQLQLAGPFIDEPSRRKFELAQRSAAGSALVYHGPLARDDVSAFLADVDIFLFPSRYRNEAEPLVVLEALSAGVPALAFSVGCLGNALAAHDLAPSTEAAFKERLSQLTAGFSDLPPGRARESFRALADQVLLEFTPCDFDPVMKELTDPWSVEASPSS